MPKRTDRPAAECSSVSGRSTLAMLLLALASVLVLAAACGGDDSPTGSGETATPSGSQSSATPSGSTTVDFPAECSEGAPPDGLISRLDLGSDKGLVQQGDDIPATVTFTNCGDKVVRLFYKDGQRYDFTIQDEDDTEVWRWSEDQSFTKVTGEEQIKPGDTVEYTEVWDQHDSNGDEVPPGRYKLLALSIGCVDESASDCHFGIAGFIEIEP